MFLVALYRFRFILRRVFFFLMKGNGKKEGGNSLLYRILQFFYTFLGCIECVFFFGFSCVIGNG